MKHGLRLAACGDLLTAAEYSAWMQQSVATTYQQVHAGAVLVKPWTLKPSPRWRRSDCEAALENRDLVLRQRQARAKKRLAIAS